MGFLFIYLIFNLGLLLITIFEGKPNSGSSFMRAWVCMILPLLAPLMLSVINLSSFLNKGGFLLHSFALHIDTQLRKNYYRRTSRDRKTLIINERVSWSGYSIVKKKRTKGRDRRREITLQGHKSASLLFFISSFIFRGEFFFNQTKLPRCPDQLPHTSTASGALKLMTRQTTSGPEVREIRN